MKIVMITHDTKIDRRIVLEAESLIQAGYEVCIIAFPWDAADDRDTMVEIIRSRASLRERTARITYRTVLKKILPQAICKRLAKIYSAVFRQNYEQYFENFLLDLVLEHPADVYHVHDLPSLSTGVKAAKRYGAKLVYDSHELFLEQGLTWLDRRKWGVIEKKYICYADYVITVNESIAVALAACYHIKRPAVIMNKTSAAVPSAFDREAVRKKIRKQYHIPQDQAVLLYQGGLVESRNLLGLIDIIRQCKGSWSLVFLGSGDYQKKLKEYAAEDKQVYFIDEVPQKDLLEHTIGLADMGIIPYAGDCLNNYYCTPNKLFEFIAAGIPILTNDLPEVAKVVAGYDIGKVVDIFDTQKVALILDDILAGHEQIDRYRCNIAGIQKEYSWEYEAHILLDIYAKLE